MAQCLAGSAKVRGRMIHQSEVIVPAEAVTKMPHRPSAFLMATAISSPSLPG
jgi:hypothetical protein